MTPPDPLRPPDAREPASIEDPLSLARIGVRRACMDLGLERAGGGYSAIETLVARGQYADAAEAYRERAQDPARAEAALPGASAMPPQPRLDAAMSGQARTFPEWSL